jgi:hypothetical protein
MKMVTALLVLGLLAAGCVTEQWSQSTRDILVNDCIADIQEEMEDDSQVGRHLRDAGISTHDACRCQIENLEAEYSEVDFFQDLNSVEQQKFVKQVTNHCRRNLLESPLD